MLKQEDGFSMIELLIAMVVFIVTVAATSNVFLTVVAEFKQQSKISETTLQDIVGLEILRRDIEHAGYGVPWTIPGGVGYSEPGAAPIGAVANDSPGAAPPRALVGGNNLPSNPPFMVAGSDYLVVKSMTATSNFNAATGVNVAQNWTRLGNGDIKRNGLSGQFFAGGDNVIVINPGATGATQRSLVANAVGSYATTYFATGSFAPTGLTTNIIYGVDPVNVDRPFNRADYYISDLSTSPMAVPFRCAPGTGVLVKAEVLHDGADTLVEQPLLDCVADMQVVYQVDNDENGTIDIQTNNIGLGGLNYNTAPLVRNRVKEVRVYILYHEGKMDPDYTHAAAAVNVGEVINGNFYGRAAFPLPSPNYRWKLHTLVVRPDTLR